MMLILVLSLPQVLYRNFMLFGDQLRAVILIGVIRKICKRNLDVLSRPPEKNG